MRDIFKKHVDYVCDDALMGEPLGANQHAIVREAGDVFKYGSRIVVARCTEGLKVVAVHSYLDVPITDEEASELVGDFMEELFGEEAFVVVVL